MGLPLSAVSSGADRPRVPALTGLRFLAALLVLVGHTGSTVFPFANLPAWIPQVYPALATLGMSLFFVLSGFVIHYNYASLFQTESPGRALYSFVINRVARLYPLFFCFLLVNLAIWPGGPYLGQLWYLLPQYLTFTQSWLFSITVLGDLSLMQFYAPSWSLSVEFFFYILFPLFVLPLTRLVKPTRALLAWLAALIGGYTLVWTLYRTRALVLPWAAMLSVEHVNLEDRFGDWLSYFCPLVRLPEFLLGCLTAQLFLSLQNVPVKRWEKTLGNSTLLLSVGAIGYLWWTFVQTSAGPGSFFYFFRMNFLYAGPVALLIFCCVRYPSGMTRWLDWPAVVLLGESSYSVYLVHISLVWQFARSPAELFSLSRLLQRLFTFAVAIASVLIVSLGTYRLIEVPGRRWLRESLGRLPLPPERRLGIRVAVLMIYLLPVLGLAGSFFAYRTCCLPSLLVTRAEHSQEKGQLQDALAALDRSLQLRPRYMRALCKRGEIQLALGNPVAALADLERALLLGSIDAQAMFHRGKAHLLLGQRQAAELELTQAIQSKPDLAAAYQLRGQLRREARRPRRGDGRLPRRRPVEAQDCPGLFRSPGGGLVNLSPLLRLLSFPDQFSRLTASLPARVARPFQVATGNAARML